MNDRTRRAIYVVAGGYLVYLGAKLLMGIRQGEGNAIVSLVGGIAFALFGVWLIVDYIRFMKKEMDESKDDEE